MYPTHKHLLTRALLIASLVMGSTTASGGAFFHADYSTDDPVHARLGFAAHPQSITTEADKPATLSVLVKGPVKSIQWRVNRDPIPGATETSYVIQTISDKLNPDEYDVIIEDAFGNTAISQTALVRGMPANAEPLLHEQRRVESLKLQAIFNLIDLFDQVGARISEPLQDWSSRKVSIEDYFNGCADRAKGELINPETTEGATHQALKLEMNSCFLPKSDHFGNEIGAVVSGTYIQSRKKEHLPDKDIWRVEKFAKNLQLTFPRSTIKNTSTIDFDILLNGKLTHTTEVSQQSTKNAKISEEYAWTKGTQIENPQSGVQASFVSGTYTKQRFGYFQGNQFYTIRETELFQKFKLKLNGQNVEIQGLVNKITENSAIHRTGQFTVLVDGKKVLSTPSSLSTLTNFSGNLPLAPKLNGFFINDHYSGAKQQPIKLVTPEQFKLSKIN